MTIDKIRIKKYQQPKVEQWSQALDIPVTRFIEDAISFYLRYLEGKQIIAIATETVNHNEQKSHREVIDADESDDFDGGIEL